MTDYLMYAFIGWIVLHLVASLFISKPGTRERLSQADYIAMGLLLALFCISIGDSETGMGQRAVWTLGTLVGAFFVTKGVIGSVQPAQGRGFLPRLRARDAVIFATSIVLWMGIQQVAQACL